MGLPIRRCAPVSSSQESKVHLELRVLNQDGTELYFRVKRGCPLLYVFKTYCDREKFNLDDVRFFFDGVEVYPDQTPDELEMYDVDYLKVYHRDMC